MVETRLRVSRKDRAGVEVKPRGAMLGLVETAVQKHTEGLAEGRYAQPFHAMAMR